TNGILYDADSTTVNSAIEIIAVFSNLSAQYEPYDIRVTNLSNLYGQMNNVLYINESPIWVTPSGSLGSFNQPVSITLSALSATDAESSPITYSVASGSSLPSGISLNSSTGVISGNLPTISSTTRERRPWSPGERWWAFKPATAFPWMTVRARATSATPWWGRIRQCR
ncbi:MAG: hypothetical protein EBY93_05070, partial [Actinobacteria bacterium]|nr:hypothetical protein [Actinomycetota bacterium]